MHQQSRIFRAGCKALVAQFIFMGLLLLQSAPAVAQPELLTAKQRVSAVEIGKIMLQNYKQVTSELLLAQKNYGADLYVPDGVKAYIVENTTLAAKALKTLRSEKPVPLKKYLEFSRAKGEISVEPISQIIFNPLLPIHLMGSIAAHRIYKRKLSEYQDELKLPRKCRASNINGVGCLMFEFPPVPPPKPRPISVEHKIDGGDGKWSYVSKELSIDQAIEFLDTYVVIARYPELRLGYIIGDIELANDRPDVMMQFDMGQKQGDVAATERALAKVDKQIDKIKERGRRRLAEENKRLKPLKDALYAARNPVRSKAKPTAKQRLRARRIGSATKRVENLNRAVANLEDQLIRTPESSVRLRQDLALTLSNLKIEFLENQENLEKDLKDQKADDVKSGAKIDRKAYLKAKDAYETARFEYQFRMNSLDGELEDKDKAQRRHIDDLANLNREIAKASSELVLEIARRRDVLEQINTKDVLIYFNFDFQQLNELNKSLVVVSDALKNATRRREEARTRMIDAVEEAGFSGERLNLATYASYLSQASLDALDQIKDVLEAGAKGGPGAALAEAVHKIAFNTLDIAIGGGPTFQDGAPTDWNPLTGIKSREEFFKDQASSLAQRFTAKNYKGKPIESGTAQVVKVVGNYLKGGIQLDLQEVKLQKLEKAAFSTAGKTPALSANLKKQFEQEFESLSTSRQTWSEKTMGKGIGGFTKRFFGDQMKAQGKALVIDVLKKELAQLFQAGPMRDYLDAQVAVAQSVDTFRRFGDMYWGRKSTYKLLAARRKKLLKDFELRSDDQIVMKLNREFEPEAGYRFNLFFIGKEYSDQVEAEVWVAGRRLNSGKIPNTYEMSAELAKYLKDTDLPAELPIEVEIK